MVKNGVDWHRLPDYILDKFRLNFSRWANRNLDRIFPKRNRRRLPLGWLVSLVPTECVALLSSISQSTMALSRSLGRWIMSSWASSGLILWLALGANPEFAVSAAALGLSRRGSCYLGFAESVGNVHLVGCGLSSIVLSGVTIWEQRIFLSGVKVSKETVVLRRWG